jgi:MFS/sugar transport protein
MLLIQRVSWSFRNLLWRRTGYRSHGPLNYQTARYVPGFGRSSKFNCTKHSNTTQPYLLSLGLSKSLMALVWIAGPLSGSLVQPYIGIRSDNSRTPWGKRRPFMIAGGIATIISLLALAWTREFVRGIMGIFGAEPESRAVTNSIIVVAVLFVYVLDFAINTGETKRQLFTRWAEADFRFVSQSKQQSELSLWTTLQPNNRILLTPGPGE